MAWVQNKTTRSPIRAPEVVRRDVEDLWNFLKNGRILGHID